MRAGAFAIALVGFVRIVACGGLASAQEKAFVGHEGDVYDVAFSPVDPDLFASASFDGTVRVWRRTSDEPVAVLRGHRGKVLGVDFSADGRELASASEDRTVKIWSVPFSGESPWKIGGATFRRFAARGAHIVAVTGDGTALVIADLASGREIDRVECAAGTERLALNADGRSVVFAEPERARLWRPRSPEAPTDPSSEGRVAVLGAGGSWTFHKGRSTPGENWSANEFDDSAWSRGSGGFGFSSNESELASVKTKLGDMAGGSGYTSLFIRGRFSVDDPKRIRELALRVEIDDGFVAYLNGAEVARRGVDADPPSFSSVATSAGEPMEVEIDLATAIDKLVPGENTLAIAGFNASTSSSDFVLVPNLLAKVDAAPAEAVEPEPKIVELGTGGAGAVAIADDGARVVVARGRDVALYDGEGTQAANRAADSAVTSAAFASDGSIWLGLDDGRVGRWKAGEDAIEYEEAHAGRVASIVEAGAARISAGADGSVRVVVPGEEPRTWTAHEGEVRSLSASTIDRIVSAGNDAIRVWSAGGEKIGEAPTAGDTAIELEGGIFSTREGASWEWRSQDAAEIRTLSGHSSQVQAVRFDPRGRWVATAGADKTIRLWTGTSARELGRHESSIYSIAFEPGGELLASAGYDTTVKIWRTADGAEVASLTGHREGVSSVLFSADGEHLFSSSFDGTLRRWTTADWASAGVYGASPAWFMSVSPAADELIAVEFGGRIAVFDSENTQLLRELSVDGVVYDGAVSPDTAWIAVAQRSGTVTVLPFPRRTDAR